MSEADKMQDTWTKYCDGLPVPALGQIVPWYSTERKVGFQAGYQAANAESPWVPIADIPDEWKDGRPVVFRFPHTYPNGETPNMVHCEYEIGSYHKAIYDFYIDEDTDVEFADLCCELRLPTPLKDGDC